MRDAGAVAAVTSGDNSNIMAARVARETFEVERVVARIYDPRRAVIYQRLGIPTVATVSWTTDQVMRRLLPGESPADWTDASGTVGLVERDLPPAWVGKKLSGLDLPGSLTVTAVTRLGSAQVVRPDLVGPGRRHRARHGRSRRAPPARAQADARTRALRPATGATSRSGILDRFMHSAPPPHRRGRSPSSSSPAPARAVAPRRARSPRPEGRHPCRRASSASVTVQSAGLPTELPPADRDALVAAVGNYVTEATLASARRSSVAGSRRPARHPVRRRADGPNADAFADTEVPPAKGKVTVTLTPVNLTALADRDREDRPRRRDRRPHRPGRTPRRARSRSTAPAS